MKENNPLSALSYKHRLPFLLLGGAAVLLFVVFVIRSPDDADSFNTVPTPITVLESLHNNAPASSRDISNVKTESRIPRILHHIFLSGYDAFVNETHNPNAQIIQDWSESCKKMHPDWEYMFWDMERATSLLQESYPDMLGIFKETRECGIICNPVVLQGDIFRIVVLHAFGGLYLDMDVECWIPAESMLDESHADLILQGTSEFEGITNAIIAGTKGHPVFRKALDLIKERIDKEMTVFEKTGPKLFNDAVMSFKNPEDPEEWRLWNGGEFVMVDNDATTATRSVARVHPLGTFFTPCWAFDRECYARTVIQRGMGKLPDNNVGMHRYSGSWTSTGNEVSIHTEQGAIEAVCPKKEENSSNRK